MRLPDHALRSAAPRSLSGLPRDSQRPGERPTGSRQDAHRRAQRVICGTPKASNQPARGEIPSSRPSLTATRRVRVQGIHKRVLAVPACDQPFRNDMQSPAAAPGVPRRPGGAASRNIGSFLR